MTDVIPSPPNSPTLEIFEMPDVMKEDEERKTELLHLLPALPADEQAAVNRTKGTIPPKAANEDDETLAPVEVDTHQTQPTPIQIKPFQEPFNVTAANDNWNNNAFANYESDWLTSIVKTHNCEVKTQTDSEGKTYYLFDNGLNRILVVIVFDTLNERMVKINDVIIPLKKFLNLKQCTGIASSAGDEAVAFEPRELRSAPAPLVFGSVHCVFGDRSELVITNVTVDELMMVVSYLSRRSGIVSCGSAPIDLSIPFFNFNFSFSGYSRLKERLLMVGTGATICAFGILFGRMI